MLKSWMDPKKTLPGTKIKVWDPIAGMFERATTRSVPLLEVDIVDVLITIEGGDQHWAFWDDDRKQWEMGPR